jgi:hypothetical protein
MHQKILLTLFFIALCVGCPDPKVIEPQNDDNPPVQEDVLQGDEGQPCWDNGACRPGLLCDDGICVVPGVYDSGNDDGTSDGTADGTEDGTADGSAEGGNEGAADGFADGFADFFGGDADADAGPTEIVGWGEACGSILAPGPTCEEGLICGLLSGVCEEMCDTAGICTNCCPISGTGYCEQGLLFSFCQWENGVPPPEPEPVDAGVSENNDAGTPMSSDAGVSLWVDAGQVFQWDAGASVLWDAGMSVVIDAGQVATDFTDSGVSAAADAGSVSITDAGL